MRSLSFVCASGVVCLSLSLQAQPDPLRIPLQYRPGAYFPEGLELQGTVKLLTAPVVEMGKPARIKIEYTIGDQGVEQGMAIEIWKHFTSDLEEFQTKDPDRSAYFAVETTAPGVELERRAFSNFTGPHGANSVFPYRRVAGVALKKGKLSKGDKVFFDLGGAHGASMQTWEENLFNLRVALARGFEGKVAGYGGDAILKVIGGPAVSLKVQAPSIVGLAERFAVEVVPQDRYNSLARNHVGLEPTSSPTLWPPPPCATSPTCCTTWLATSPPTPRASCASKSAPATAPCAAQATPSG